MFSSKPRVVEEKVQQPSYRPVFEGTQHEQRTEAHQYYAVRSHVNTTFAPGMTGIMRNLRDGQLKEGPLSSQMWADTWM